MNKRKYAPHIFFLTIFCVSLAVVLNNIYQFRLGNDALLNSRYENLWAAHELESELQRLLLTLSRHEVLILSDDLEAIRLRLDILWSRIPPVLDGPTGVVLREVTEIKSIAAALEAELRSLSDLLDGEPASAAALADAVSALESFQPPMREVVIASLHQAANSHVELQRRLDEIFVSSLVVCAALASSSAALIAMLFVQLRRSQQRWVQEKEFNATIYHLAHHDSLTGLPNRRFFNETLPRIFSEAQAHGDEIAVHFIDVDNFKAMNDAFGHTIGDAFLVAASERMTQALGPRSTLARIAGDEFAAIQPSARRPDEARNFGRRLLEAFAQPFHIGGHRVQASISIGSARFPSDGLSTNAILMNADVSLHQAKSNGRGQHVLFDSRTPSDEQRRRQIDVRLGNSLSLEQFSVLYQPIFCARSRVLVGVEALVRWNRGLVTEVSPRDFIPVAESNGSIMPIGDWVLSTACSEICTFLEIYGKEIFLAVNLSPSQLRHQSCADRFLWIIEESGVHPGWVQFEITETTLAESDPSVLSNIARLRGSGSKICLDDFGTGYSNLSRLQAFPLDAMKLDRDFVANLENMRTRCICEWAIGLGRRLGLEIVGEGVETEHQYRDLVRMGCDQIQGFYLGHPMPLADLTQRFVALNNCSEEHASGRTDDPDTGGVTPARLRDLVETGAVRSWRI